MCGLTKEKKKWRLLSLAWLTKLLAAESKERKASENLIPAKSVSSITHMNPSAMPPQYKKASKQNGNMKKVTEGLMKIDDRRYLGAILVVAFWERHNYAHTLV